MRRCRHEIVRDILKFCDSEGHHKTRIQNFLGMASPRVNQYLEDLKYLELIMQTGKTYHTTMKGRNYLALFRTLERHLS